MAVVRRVDNHFVPWLKGRFFQGILSIFNSQSS